MPPSSVSDAIREILTTDYSSIGMTTPHNVLVQHLRAAYEYVKLQNMHPITRKPFIKVGKMLYFTEGVFEKERQAEGSASRATISRLLAQYQVCDVTSN